MHSAPTIPRRASPLPPEARRAAIIAAALPLLIEHGRGVTSRQIATAAGVSEGTVFNVFADKDDLLATAFATACDPAPFEREIAAIDPLLDVEAQLLRATAVIQRRIADIWRLVSHLGPHRHDPKHGPLPDSPALAAIFASDPDLTCLDPVDAARTLRALTLALTHPMITHDPRPADEIVGIFLHGVAAPARERSARSETPA